MSRSGVILPAAAAALLALGTGTTVAQEAPPPSTSASPPPAEDATALPKLEVTAKKQKAAAKKPKPQPVTQIPAAATSQPQSTGEPKDLNGTPDGPADGPVSGYSARSAGAAMKSDTPLLETPQAVSVVTRDLIEDRGVQSINESLSTVPGFVGGATYFFSDNYTLRGFTFNEENYFGNYRDGRRTASYAPLDPELYERIEVVKGPASVLYGALEPGGFVNQVTKRPVLGFNGGSVKQEFGSYDFFKTVLDVNASTDTVGIRLPVSYGNFNSFRDYVDGEDISMAPTLTWLASPDTKISLIGTYVDRKKTDDTIAIPIQNDEIFTAIPRSRFLGEPSFENKIWYASAGIELEHRFNENVTLRSSVSYGNGEGEYENALVFANPLAGSILSRQYSTQDQEYEAYSTQHDLLMKFSAFGVDHSMVAGVEAYKITHGASNVFTIIGGISPIDVFNPVYDDTLLPGFVLLDNVNTHFETKLFGAYVQDQITLIKNQPGIHKLDVIAGVRYDDIEQVGIQSGTWAGGFLPIPPHQSLNAQKYSPRGALLWMPTERLSLYGSYSESFNPNPLSFTPIEDNAPTEGKQYEIGAKYELQRGLFASVAAFDITKTNIPGPSPIPLLSELVGEAESKGIEFELTGEILPGWNIAAAYTLLKTEITDGSENVGNELRFAPNQFLGLWTGYTFQPGSAIAGFGFGGGLTYVAESFESNANTAVVPSYTLVDAALWYRPEKTGPITPEYAINFKNLTDEKYYLPGGSNVVQPGAPFTVLGSIKLNF